VRALQRMADAARLVAHGLSCVGQPEERAGDVPGELASVSVAANSAAEPASLSTLGSDDARCAMPDGEGHAAASADAISAALWKRAERSFAQARANHASKPRGTTGLICEGTGGVDRMRS
jgi:hypothetical protein